MSNRKKLSDQEIKSLESNPYVFSVNNERISYTNDFKKLFISEYNKGMKPTAIFRKYGFDTTVLGARRIERAAFHWKKSYSHGTLGTHKAYSFDNLEVTKNELRKYKEELKQMKRKLCLLEQLIKKIESSSIH